MSDEVLIALFSLLGTVIGSAAGILVANKLTAWRLVKVEESVKSAHHRIDDIFTQLHLKDSRRIEK